MKYTTLNVYHLSLGTGFVRAGANAVPSAAVGAGLLSMPQLQSQ